MASSFVEFQRFLRSNDDEQIAARIECERQVTALGARRDEAVHTYVASLPDVLYLLMWRSAYDDQQVRGIYTSVDLARQYARDRQHAVRKDLEIVVKHRADLFHMYGFTSGKIPVDMEPRLE